MKISLLGEGGVGKTTLVKGFMEGKITRDYSPTVGVDVGKTTVNLEINDEIAEIHFQLWDLAGQSAYKKFASERGNDWLKGQFFAF